MARSPTVSRESRSLTRSEDRVWEMKERRNNIREREPTCKIGTKPAERVVIKQEMGKV